MRPAVPALFLLLLAFSGCAMPSPASPNTSSENDLGTGSNSSNPLANTTTTTQVPVGSGILRELDCDIMGSRDATEDGILARSNTSYQEAWLRLCSSSGREPPAEVPPVDFPREQALLYSWGTKPSGGFSVEILGLDEVGGEIVAQVRRTSPGSTCTVFWAITYPAASVAIEAMPEMPLRWEFEDVTYSCA